MAPILSKLEEHPPKNAEDAIGVIVKRLRPSILQLFELMRSLDHQSRSAAQSISELLNKVADRAVHHSTTLLESCCCFNLEQYMRGRNKPELQGSLPIFFVVFLLVMLYKAFVFCYMPAAGIAIDSPTSLVFHAFVVLSLASFAKAARTDPGDIPSSDAWRRFGQVPPEAKERKRGTGEARWCRKSRAYKPDRAHYCRVMGRAVLRMDHHCPWLGNTIGFWNYKHFLLFLFYANAACAMLGTSILGLLLSATLPALTTFLLIGAEALATLLLTILGPFFVFHCLLLARNLTTIEFCELRGCSSNGESAFSPYDQGLFRNIQSVLGTNPLGWLLPFSGPPGDGLSFPRGPAAEQYDEGEEEWDGADPEASHPKPVHPQPKQISLELQEAPEPALQEAHAPVQAEQSTDAESHTEGFLVWRDGDEFTNDLRIGCEAIHEGFRESLLRLTSLCVRPEKKERKTRGSGGWKRPSAVRIVPVRGGRHSECTSSSSASGREFLAGI